MKKVLWNKVVNNYTNIMNISTKSITFLENIPKNIDVIKTEKSFYFKSFLIQHETISRFICGLPENQVFLINPFISRYDLSSDPYLTLSKQFLIYNKSNPNLITNYLIRQLEKAELDLGVDLIENCYHLIWKCKSVTFKEKFI